MGYGAGAFLIAVGLILALAVNEAVSGVDLQMIGWILTIVGVIVLALTAFTLNKSRGTVQTTQHSDGTVTERRTRMD
ncbi:DUF6458 family protein [Nocardioides acrostichi]|uniref:DUF6458 domain-containing protein n=1 Tax=Nocardioides acrostichi TaxID=2784339 RepID=A0A930UYT7_9ACTN|nr:DUF6458 family protein [Nocardioides acrostichi]MBF4160515.1 hypothetical protein [Nocardioides acrostichi]